MTKLHELAAQGQSIWYDNIRRGIMDSGEFQALLDQGVLGVTSNPSIFEKAIAQSSDYDEAMNELIAQGLAVKDIYETLATEDIGRAADLLHSIYEQTDGIDGYVSLEVSPLLAHDTEGTIEEARRLYATLNRPNVMIKVPATPAGLPAITTLIGEGINVNVTLIFSLGHYEAVAEAYLAGLEKLAAASGDLSKVASVASVFISRADGKLDPILAEKGRDDLGGKIANANAKMIYASFKKLFAGPRWDALAAQGARVQRPLWASTSTKNPTYPDTLYIDTLVGPHTVNTVPPATIDAILDHGATVSAIENGLAEAQAQLAVLPELGIDLDALMQDLQDVGVDSFAQAFDSLLGSVEAKRQQLMEGNES